MTRAQANLLRAFAGWTLWVWGTRIVNLWGGDESTGFKLVHTVLAVVSIGFALATLVVVSRVRRRALARTLPSADGTPDDAVVRAADGYRSVMGQPVAVVEKRARPGVVRFEANRYLTGMGHEWFASPADAVGPRPAAELARRLFDTGQVDRIHIYGNIVTVELARGDDASGLREVVEDLYIYYRPGFVPPPLEMPEAEEPAAANEAAPTPSGGGEPAAVSEAAKKIPAHLLERSRQAKERAKAKAAEAG